MIDSSFLSLVGHDPLSAPTRARVLTANGLVLVPRVSEQALDALGQQVNGFDVLAQRFPANAGFDGLIGLDFVLGLTLTIDFRTNQITLV
jgi:hypothetical protein